MTNMGESSDSDSREQPETRLTLSGKDFSQYTYDGNFCVYIKLVHDRKEAEEDIRKDAHYPDFVHQFFVDQERIFGYKRPIIRLFYSASRLKRYVNFDYEAKLTRETDGVDADNVMSYLNPVLEDMDYTQNLNQFIEDVESKEEKEFRPPGSLLSEFELDYKKPKHLSRAQIEQLEMAGETLTNGNGDSHLNGSSNLVPHTSRVANGLGENGNSDPNASRKMYQIFHANAETKNFGPFQARMQSLIMWFIESATMIDYQDPRWDFFIIFEKYNQSKENDPTAPSVSTEDKYYFVGYSTVYRYYAYPDRTRPRVSQMVIMPPYRRNRLGTTLLQTIYDFYKKQPATLDITAEDPDEEFIAMRDFLDCKNCQSLAAFKPEKLKEGWSEDIANEARDELRLCQRQARKVYEILKLMSIDKEDDEQQTKYRLEVKNRLNIPNRRLKLDCAKVEKKGMKLDEEMQQKIENQRLILASLEENYQELVRQYNHIIDKLVKSS